MGWHSLWVTFAEAGTEQTLRTNILSPTSIQVLWTAIREARGYRLEWKRATGGLTAPGPRHGMGPATCADIAIPTGLEAPRTVSLPSSASTYQLTGLQPGTEYRITLYTLYEGGEVATPVTTFQTGEPRPRQSCTASLEQSHGTSSSLVLARGKVTVMPSCRCGGASGCGVGSPSHRGFGQEGAAGLDRCPRCH